MKNIITVKDLNYRPFNNLNIQIKENSFVAISGPNNSGKTTLMRILNREKGNNFPITILGKNISNHKISNYRKIVEALFPLEITFNELTLNDEINSIDKSISSEYILKKLNLKKIGDIEFTKLDIKTLILSKLAIILLNNPQIIIIDELNLCFSHQEIIKIMDFLREYQHTYETTIIYTTTNLEDTIGLDYLYIISDGKIILEGEPLNTLQKDNIINKIGLRIPFMIDLSVKLKDYNLLSDLELDPEGMVDKLWK